MASLLHPHDLSKNVTASFTPWTTWSARTSLLVADRRVVTYGGVYLLAHFNEPVPSGPANHLDDSIVYVGEGKNLGKRWSDFERAATAAIGGNHSGGRSHRSWRAENGAAWNTLHVAAMPIWFASEGDTDAPSSMARRFRLYMEQAVLWQLVQHRQGRADLHLLNLK